MSNNCLKTKGCYYCKEICNSAICNKWKEKETIETTSDLSSSNKDVVNERNNKEIKLKVLFDSGSEKGFLSQRTYTCLHLSTIYTENLKINTFGNENSHNEHKKGYILIKNSQK